MFPERCRVGVGISLLPPPEFAQKQIGVVSRLVDVMQNGGTTELAGIIDNDVAETQNPLNWSADI